VRHAAHDLSRPLVSMLARAGARADHLTMLGCFASLVAGLAFLVGAFRYGAILLALSGLCDLLDGELARARGGVSRFGAFLDSTLDRLGEGVVLAGIAGFYVVNLIELANDPARVLTEVSRGLEPRTWGVLALLAIVAMIASFLVSYTRARAEGLGLDCRVGWFERTERMLVLIVAGLFGVGPVMPGALLLLVVLSSVTAAQRVAYVWKTSREQGAGGPSS
jgi:CDP-diacylglycerol--glycerol-3-phosphate 3-phosphatidyltransferase